jgi:hypothetical protein
LKEMDELYKDYRHPNVESSKILTNKTVEQIKNKRKRLKIQEASSEEEEMVTDGGCDPVDPGNAPNFKELEKDH